MGPVRNARNNYAFDISEDFVERRSPFRCHRIQLRQDCSRFVIRGNPPLTDIFAVIGDPVDEPMKLLTKKFRRNIPELANIAAEAWFLIFHSSGCGRLEISDTIFPSSARSRSISIAEWARERIGSRYVQSLTFLKRQNQN